MKVLSCILFVIIFLMALFFIIKPAVPVFNNMIYPVDISSLENGRNYYSILSSIATILIGLIGFVFGLYYYHNKKEYEDECKRNDKKISMIRELINVVDAYDGWISEIFSFNYSDKRRLDTLRLNIQREYETLISILELCLDAEYLTNNEVKIALEAHSLIDKSIIMSNITIKRNDKNIYIIKDQYANCYKVVKHLLFSKIK